MVLQRELIDAGFCKPAPPRIDDGPHGLPLARNFGEASYRGVERRMRRTITVVGGEDFDTARQRAPEPADFGMLFIQDGA